MLVLKHGHHLNQLTFTGIINTIHKVKIISSKNIQSQIHKAPKENLK